MSVADTDLAALTSRLVAIDSTNPDLVPGGAGELEAARFVAGWLREAGLEVEIVDSIPTRPSVIARARGTGGGPTLLLNGHLDTVGAGGMDKPHEPRLEGRRLHGRGAVDMKGGVAACMAAAAAAANAGLRGDVVLTAVADEEYASAGTRAIVERVRADAAIVAEPSGLEQLCVAHKGFAWFEVTTHGRAAHGSRPDLGVDAIAHMGAVLGELEALSAELARRPHRLLGSGTVHASLIEGGQELSTYPERCVLKLERRTLPGDTPTSVATEVEALLGRCSEGRPGFVAEWRELLWREPFEVDPQAAIVQIVREETARVTGRAPEPVGAPAWMDAALLSAAGIPTVVLGPGGSGAHADEEWVDLDDVDRCAQIYLHAARRVCA